MSIQINLLPWREEQRNKKAKSSVAFMIGGAILGVLVAGGYYGYLEYKNSDYTKATSYIQAKIKALEPKKKTLDELKQRKIKLNNQLDSIEALQENRASATHMIEELSIAMPEEVFLNEFSLSNGGNVTIEGEAKNDSEIAKLMTNLRASEWYIDPSLVFIRQDQGQTGEIKSFMITSKLQLPGNEITEASNGK